MAKTPQWEQGQGAAGMPQERLGWVKRPQERPWVTWNRARAAIEPQDTWAVAQPPEAKVGGASNPLLWVAQPPQPWVGGLVKSPVDAPARRTPPNLQASHVLMARQLLLAPPRWQHLSPGGLLPPPIPPPRAGEPALHSFQPGAATLPVWQAPYPGPLS